MAYREVARVEIQEIIRRWQLGEGHRRIASGTGASRNTIRKYLGAAAAAGISVPGHPRLQTRSARWQPWARPGC